MQQRNCYKADVNTASSGDNTLVAASTGNPIKVWQIWIDASGGANNLIFKNGTTALNASPLNLVANGTLTFQSTDQPWFECTVGNAFVINLSAATQISGQVWYTLG